MIFHSELLVYQRLHGEKPRGCTMDTMMYMDVYHVFVQEYGCWLFFWIFGMYHEIWGYLWLLLHVFHVRWWKCLVCLVMTMGPCRSPTVKPSHRLDSTYVGLTWFCLVIFGCHPFQDIPSIQFNRGVCQWRYEQCYVTSLGMGNIWKYHEIS